MAVVVTVVVVVVVVLVASRGRRKHAETSHSPLYEEVPNIHVHSCKTRAKHQTRCRATDEREGVTRSTSNEKKHKVGKMSRFTAVVLQ